VEKEEEEEEEGEAEKSRAREGGTGKGKEKNEFDRLPLLPRGPNLRATSSATPFVVTSSKPIIPSRVSPRPRYNRATRVSVSKYRVGERKRHSYACRIPVGSRTRMPGVINQQN